MSLDISLMRKRWVSYDEGKTHIKDNEKVYEANVTHNLGNMAKAAGIYKAIWRPYLLKCENEVFLTYKEEYKYEEKTEVLAKDIISLLKKGLKKMKNDPEKFKSLNPPNGWGVYEDFIYFVEEYLNACCKYPDAIIDTWR